MASPTIFDKSLARHRLGRAAAGTPADFLLVRAAEDIADRLLAVRRRFADIADIGTPGPALAKTLADRLPDARIVRIAPLAERGAAFTERGAAFPERGAAFPERGAAFPERGAAFPERGAAFPIVQGDAETLPLLESLDLAVSALALQNANDLPGALVQIRRALKPDGLFLGALIGGRTLQELRAVLTEADMATSGGASPRVAPFADVRDMGGLLQRAGFALPVADSEVLTVRYDNLFALMADLRAMGATNALVARSHRPSRRDFFERAAILYAERFADPDRRIRASFEIISLSGWAPHESQQKPAKRGSATISLARVLGRQEP